MQILRALEAGDFTIEEIDAITGPAIGRPKSATFRTMDIAGIDVLAHVARNLAERLDDVAAREMFALPPLVEQLVARGAIGEKAGQGFYKRVKAGGHGGSAEISDARSRHADLPAEAAGPASGARCRALD